MVRLARFEGGRALPSIGAITPTTRRATRHSAAAAIVVTTQNCQSVVGMVLLVEAPGRSPQVAEEFVDVFSIVARDLVTDRKSVV